MLIVLTLLFFVGGWSGLALSMTRHHRDFFGFPGDPGRLRAFRLSGAGLLVVGLGLSLLQWGMAVGFVAALGSATFATLSVSLTLGFVKGGRYA